MGENAINIHVVPVMPIVIYEGFGDLSIEKVLLLQFNQGVRSFGEESELKLCL